LALINRYGCRQCHQIAGTGGNFGPALDDGLLARLTSTLNDPAYAERVAEVDKLDNEPFSLYRDERREILSLEGEERARHWLAVYLQEPLFDNPKSRMGSLEVTEAHAAILAEHLLGRAAITAETEFSTLDRVRFFIAAQIPELRYRHMILAFVAGGLLGGGLLILFYIVFIRRRTSG